MRKIAVIDAETDPAKHGRVPAPFIWGYYDGETYEQFYSTNDLMMFLYPRDEIIYAHNGGKFDYHFLFDYIEPFSEVMVISGRLSKFTIGECEFRDSINILPTALSAFSKDEFNYKLMEKGEREKPHNKKQIETYLYSDCVNLFNYVTGFIDRFGLNLTVAGTAFKQWQMISEREPPSDFKGELYEALSDYYYGGRCEAFETGIIDEDLQLVDINSAYPYAMLSEHPFSTEYIEVNHKQWIALSEHEKGPTLITVRCVSVGALPYRSKTGDLFFPADKIIREFKCTGWELLSAIKTGHITGYKIIKGFIFDELIDFKDYILKFYKERLTAKELSDTLGNILSKLMMNGLYGKFASNPDQYNNYMIIEPGLLDETGVYHDEAHDKMWEFSGVVGSNALVSEGLEDYEKQFYNIATAASITGYVRAYMWESMNACEGVAYCDTDSITCRKIGDLPNGIGKELGQWDVEGNFTGGAIAGKKLYAFKYADKEGYKTASKGVRLEAKEIIKVAKGGEVTYKPEFPTFSMHKGPRFTNRAIKMTKKVLQD